MNLFEETIIKQSVKLLMDEENVNVAIEKIFVNLEKETKRQNEQIIKEEKNQ
jgi:hypothetical protein